MKPSLSHKLIFDVSTMVLVVYSAALTLFFSQKEFAIYSLGYYCSITFLQDILFAIKTQNELAVEKNKVDK